MKLLLENPDNARELLTLAGRDVVKLIDFERLRIIKTTFVARDYRHMATDVVLAAPVRRGKVAGRRRQRILVYILIEHQSEPDRSMPLRLLEYVVQVFSMQRHQWRQSHSSEARLMLDPVLPVVFYTGTRRWDSIPRLVDLVQMGERFRRQTPAMEPLFVDLSVIEPQSLERQGCFFSWILRLVQQRRLRPGEFKRLLVRVIRHLEAMQPMQRSRWLELLSYIHAMIYHDRSDSEHSGLREALETTVQAGENRQEVVKMVRSMADVLKEQGRKEGQEHGREQGRKEGHKEGRKQGQAEAQIDTARSTLVRLVRKRFGKLPKAVLEAIHGTADLVSSTSGSTGLQPRLHSRTCRFRPATEDDSHESLEHKPMALSEVLGSFPRRSSLLPPSRSMLGQQELRR